VADGLHTWTDTWTPRNLDTCSIETVEISKLTERTNLCKRGGNIREQIKTFKI
jgi:hypothetical protein